MNHEQWYPAEPPRGNIVVKERCKFCLQKEVYWDSETRRSYCHNCNRDMAGKTVVKP